MSDTIWHFNQNIYDDEINYQFLQKLVDPEWNFEELSNHPNFDISWIDIFPDANWDFKKISRHRNLKLAWITQDEDKPWDFYYFMVDCPKFDISWIEALPHKWQYLLLTRNTEKFELSWLTRFPDKDWDFHYLSHNLSLLTLDILKEYPDENWDVENLLYKFEPLELQIIMMRNRTILYYKKKNHNLRDSHVLTKREAMPYLILNPKNLRFCSYNLQTDTKLRTVLPTEDITDKEIENMKKILDDNYSLENYYPGMLLSIDLPLFLSDLSGETFEISNWFDMSRKIPFPTQDILRLIHERFPELDGCDIYMEDRFFSKMYDRDIKQILLDMNYEPELMIVYPEQVENLD